MELDPDMDELIRVCDGLMQYLNDDEGEEIGLFYLHSPTKDCSSL